MGRYRWIAGGLALAAAAIGSTCFPAFGQTKVGERGKVLCVVEQTDPQLKAFCAGYNDGKAEVQNSRTGNFNPDLSLTSATPRIGKRRGGGSYTGSYSVDLFVSPDGEIYKYSANQAGNPIDPKEGVFLSYPDFEPLSEFVKSDAEEKKIKDAVQEQLRKAPPNASGYLIDPDVIGLDIALGKIK